MSLLARLRLRVGGEEATPPTPGGGGDYYPSAGMLRVGLRGYYRLNGNFTDASGNAQTVTDLGGSTFGAGKIGNALLTIGGTRLSIAGVTGEGPLTLAAWVRFDAGELQGPLDGFGLGWYPALFLGASGRNVIWDVDGPALTPPVGTWVHLGITRSVTGGVTGYYNGSVWGRSNNSPATVSDFLICSGTSAPFCPVDAVGVWDRALSAFEVTTLYNAGAGFDPTA